MKHIVMIGAGNVATSLAHALQGAAVRPVSQDNPRETYQVTQVFSRQLAHAQRLARALGCEAIDSLSDVSARADVVIVAVPDDAIAGVVASTAADSALWLHTSGSVGMEVFAGHRTRYGVLYPLQSFSRELPVDLRQTHLFVEGCDAATTGQVWRLAQALSAHVAEADSSRRRILHLAAVFACNFANHMWTLADEVLDGHGLPFEALLPLIETTVTKLRHISPALSQTGPAARGDVAVLRRHLALLDDEKAAVYRLLSQDIMNRNNKSDNQDGI